MLKRNKISFTKQCQPDEFQTTPTKRKVTVFFNERCLYQEIWNISNETLHYFYKICFSGNLEQVKILFSGIKLKLLWSCIIRASCEVRIFFFLLKIDSSLIQYILTSFSSFYSPQIHSLLHLLQKKEGLLETRTKHNNTVYLKK